MKNFVKNCIHHGELISSETSNRNECKYCKKEYYRKNKEKIKERISLYIKEDRKQNPEKYKLRQDKYQKKYRELITKKTITRRLNIELHEYEQMFIAQNNKCYICKKEETKISGKNGKINRLSLDHCHKTMKVRKLLCHNCNIMIGACKDSIDILRNAVNYLKEFGNGSTERPTDTG